MPLGSTGSSRSTRSSAAPLYTTDCCACVILPACSRTAATTVGWQWPVDSTPMPDVKSRSAGRRAHTARVHNEQRVCDTFLFNAFAARSQRVRSAFATRSQRVRNAFATRSQWTEDRERAGRKWRAHTALVVAGKQLAASSAVDDELREPLDAWEQPAVVFERRAVASGQATRQAARTDGGSPTQHFWSSAKSRPRGRRRAPCAARPEEEEDAVADGQ
eukprot:133217-Prymnesium_polylepis.1